MNDEFKYVTDYTIRWIKYISIRNDIRKSVATLMVTNIVADYISNHFFTSIGPMIKKIKEINNHIGFEPDSLPFYNIQVILFPNIIYLLP